MPMMAHTKTRSYVVLIVLLILSLVVASCSSSDGGDKRDESKGPQPPAAEVTKAAAEKATPADEQPTKVPSTGEEAKPTEPAAASEKKPATGLFADPHESLDSYRMRTKMMQKEGVGTFGQEMTTEIEWVRDPEARHTALFAPSGDVIMEIITIGDDTWTSMGDGTWMHTKAGTGEGETPFSAGDFQASLEDILKDWESSMKRVGKDVVDGVDCERYTVDTDFSLPFPMPEEASAEAQQFLPKEMEGHIEGEVCVADQRGLPKVIVRSETTQEITIKFAAGKEETMAYDEERELYDINKPVTIEAPE
jgi:hypothetical protein